MSKSGKKKSGSTSVRVDAGMRKALTQLQPPPREMLLASDVLALARKLASGKMRPADIQSDLEKIMSRPSPSLGVIELFTLVSKYVNATSSLATLLNGLYVPTNALGTELAINSYSPGSISINNGPSTANNEAAKTGSLVAAATVAQTTMATKLITSFSSVAAVFDTNPPGYGPVNLVTASARVDWTGSYTGTGDLGPQGQNTGGTLLITGTIKVVAFEFDRAAGMFVLTPGNNTESYQVFSSPSERAVDSAALMSFKGTFNSSHEVSLKFNADPGKTYAVFVFAEVDITSNFSGTAQGSRIPSPAPNISWEGMITANVPFIFIAHGP